MISSLSNDKIKRVISLRDKKRVRDEENLFITEGIKLFEDAPEQMTEEVYLTGAFLADLSKNNRKDILKKLEITGFEEVTEQVMNKMSSTVTPQGILSVIKKPLYSLNELLGEETLLIILERIQDPGNLGTIMRSSEGAGASGVVMSSDCVDLFSPKSVRSTMGSVFRVPFVYSDEIFRDIEVMKKTGISVFGAAPGGNNNYCSCDYTGGSAFLIGNESAGLSERALRASDHLVAIPMGGKLESLNAGVSASILLYEAKRQRMIRSAS